MGFSISWVALRLPKDRALEIMGFRDTGVADEANGRHFLPPPSQLGGQLFGLMISNMRSVRVPLVAHPIPKSSDARSKSM